MRWWQIADSGKMSESNISFNAKINNLLEATLDPEKDRSGEWTLFKRQDKTVDGVKYFYEKWYHAKSNSGIVCFSQIDENTGKRYFKVEGYGIGTLNNKFKEINGTAPKQKTEHNYEKDARQALNYLMNDNAYLAEGGTYRDRQRTVRQRKKRNDE